MVVKELPHYSYLKFLLKYRILFLVMIAVFVGYSVFTIKDGFVYSNDSLWLEGSKEYDKLLNMKYPSLCVEKIVVDFSKTGWNLEAVKDLRNLQEELKWHSYVTGVNSLFEQKNVIVNKINAEQSMIEFITLLDESDTFILQEIEENQRKYQSFIDIDKAKATFYVLSSKEIDVDLIHCELPFELINTERNGHTKDIILFSILITILFISFTIAFRSLLPSILGIIFIASTTVTTVALYQMFSAVKVTHISIVLLAIVISVMDFIYIYYKWHVLQQRSIPKDHLLYRVIAKTVVPIFWTTFISIVGIGSLMLVESQILYSMGMNVLFSSLSGFVLSYTLLPIMLSFFKQEHPLIFTKNSSKYFAEKESHYQHFGLKLFLIVSSVIFLYSVFMYVTKPMNVVANADSNQIHIALNEKGFTVENLFELQNIQNLLREKFKTIEGFESAHTEMQKLYHQEYPGLAFELYDIDVDSYQFMFDLYDITKTVMVNDHFTLTIYLGSLSNKIEILQFIRDEGILIQDRASLLDMAKMDSIDTLFAVVLFVFGLITVVVYYLTRIFQFSLIALIVNAVPIAWFFSVVMFFDIPLSTDMLVAMIITVALSSDATLHFIFYYYDNRRKPRSPELALEQSFLYIGTPIGMGNIILALTFMAFIFIPDMTIMHIGIYSSLLIALLLLMDLFVLPILFLNKIRNNMKVKGYYHGT